MVCTLKPNAFQVCFVSWLQSLRAEAAAATGVEQPILAVDVKTLRRSHDRNKDLGALHSVTVWTSDFGLTLAYVATAEKSNEITDQASGLSTVRCDEYSGFAVDTQGTQSTGESLV